MGLSRRLRPGRIRGLDSRATATTSAGRSRVCGPDRDVGPGGALRRQRPRDPPLSPQRPCLAWVTKPLRPLLGDVRVGGSGGRGGGAATTSAAASTTAAFAGGRADVRGGGAPGAKRLGACGPLVAAAATTGDGVSQWRRGCGPRARPCGAPQGPRGFWVGGGLSRSSGRHRKGVDRETRARGGDLDCRVRGKGG